MFRFSLNFFALGLTALLLLGTSARAGEPPARLDLGESMPQVLYSSTSTHSFAAWVSASAALEPSGEYDARLFHPHVIEKLKYHLSKPAGPDGCVHYGPIFHDLVGAPDWGTRKKVLANSDLVVQGTVVGKEFGFKGSVPGQLLKLKADTVFKAQLEHLDSYYVFFPVGEFSVGDIRICKTDPRFPPPPEIGDELIVSVPHRSNPDEPLLKTAIYGGEGYITLKGGKAYWSPGLRTGDQEASITDRGELLKLMTQVLKEGG